MKPVNVLQIALGGSVTGGVESFLLRYYEHMDHARVHFDFLFAGGNSLSDAQANESLKGSNLFALHILDDKAKWSDYIRLMNGVRAVLKQGCYDIVHINTGTIRVQLCCCAVSLCSGIRVRIGHSHSAGNVRRKGKAAAAIESLCHFILSHAYSDLFACSTEAGLHLFGERGVRQKKFRIIKNAIDIAGYKWNPAVRNRIRMREDIPEHAIVFGFVGALTENKNPLFLMRMFEYIHDKNKNSFLWIIGAGKLKEELERRIRERKLEAHIKLWGQRQDVPELLQAMDAFILPSFYEGLSIALVEAQAAGIPVYASDRISREHRLTERIRFFALETGAEEWAKQILENLDQPSDRDTAGLLEKNGYDIRSAAGELEEWYVKRARGKE